MPLLPCSPHFLHICSLVSHEINVLVPLFPQTPGRASVFEDTRKERNKRTIGLPILKLLARSTANKELLLKMTWDLYINLSDISQIEIMQGKVELFELSSDIYVTWMFILSASAVLKCAFSLCEMFCFILMLLNAHAVLIFLFNIKKKKSFE